MKFADFEAWTLQASPKTDAEIAFAKSILFVVLASVCFSGDMTWKAAWPILLLAQPADPQRSSGDSAIPCFHYLSPRG